MSKTNPGAPGTDDEKKLAAAAASALDGLTLELDRSRPHSEVHGEHPHNLGFIQDGLPFDKGGRLLKPLLNTEEFRHQKATVERKLSRMTAAIIEAEKNPVVDTANPEGPNKAPVDDDPDADVNLKLWAEGKIKYMPQVIYRVMRKRYSKHFGTMPEVKEWLVKEKVVDQRNLAA